MKPTATPRSFKRRMFALLSATFVIATAALVGPAVPYAAAQFVIGDVFAGVGTGLIRVYTPTGTFVQELDTLSGSSEDTGMCFDGNIPTSNLRTTNFTDNSMSRIPQVGLVEYPWGTGFNQHPESCVVALDPNTTQTVVYVGQADGSRDVLKFDLNGNLLASYDVATEDRGSDWIDLAADKCTLFYTSEGNSVKRFDVCTNTQLADFATGLPSSPCYALRIRANGEVLVACTDNVFRLSPLGTVIQTYPKAGTETSFLFALNLDPDGLSFWTAGYGTGNIYRYDITTGLIITTFTADVEVTLAGLAIFGEPVVSLPPTEEESTPGRVSLGGFIDADGKLKNPSELLLKNSPIPGGKATFGGNVRFRSGDSNPTGNVRYIDHVTGDDIKSTSFSLLVIGAGPCGPDTHARFRGKATVNGVPDQDFEVEVDDCAEPGSSPGSGPDTLMMKVTGPSEVYANGGPLVGGNIQIRKD
jgi:hypothetical protein